MAVLEGIGDEVIVSAVVLFVLLLFFLGWMYISSPEPQVHTTPVRTNVNQSQVLGEEQNVLQQLIEEPTIRELDVNISEAETNNSVEQEEHSSSGSEAAAEGGEVIDATRKKRLEFLENAGRDKNHLSNGSVPMDAPEISTVDTTPLDSEIETFDIRLKYLDDSERIVNSQPTETVAEFKTNHFHVEFSNSQTVRLIYHGQVLQDERTLASYRLTSGCCIHVQVINRTNSGRRSVENNDTELDLGQFLWPLLGVFIGVLWMFHFQYRDYFATSSTVALFGLSGLFLTVVWGQYTSRPEQVR